MTTVIILSKKIEDKLMLGSSNNLNHVPGYISSQKKLVDKILQVGAGGVIAGFLTMILDDQRGE